MTTKFNPHFVVISLGNRGQYYETLHSAGHFALLSLQKAIASSANAPFPRQPPFSNEKSGKLKCPASRGSKYTLLQSPTLMNVSGRFVASAWAQALSSLGPGALVVVHDDLEEDFGTVKVRKWTASHRGHNGVKSINACLQPKNYPGGARWWARISVGIGRPESREHADVSGFVLSRITERQKDIIDAQVGSRILACLEKMEMEWKKEFDKEVAAMSAASPKPRPKPQTAAEVNE